MCMYGKTKTIQKPTRYSTIHTEQLSSAATDTRPSRLSIKSV